MTTTVQIDIDRDVFEHLQALAKPLVDTPSSVIRRLLEPSHINKIKKNTSEDNARPVQASNKVQFTTSRGANLPLGRLRASYHPRKSNETHRFEAEITPNGIKFDNKLFESPSAASIYAKKQVGAEFTASSTNGWTFWEYFDEENNTWIDLDKIREH